ncbi:hypothetical protein EUX98_g4240 [Antrodiella citrinella]|uniref:Uncharacterized protein n=1 Tax=Antrodiella citrinella TaxID=2447956 RepID=A0A4S4MUJ4_9APHY|nr:hypothetical protein EUX98_g4240 [Antrodiella citrinella]
MPDATSTADYSKVGVTKRTNQDEHFKQTVARLEQIQGQFTSFPRNSRLKGKVCVITGVGSLKGIGDSGGNIRRASAIKYAHEGAQHLYLLDFDGSNLPDLKSTIQKAYPDVKVTTIQADASDEEAIAGVCKQALQEEGRLDVFFANAGVSTHQHLHDIGSEQFMKTLKINVLSCFLAVKFASAAMQKTNASRGKELSGGSIILTASVAGLQSGAGTLDYSASKAAVVNMAKTAPYQLQKTGIRVNAICPGLIETGMTTTTFEYAKTRGTHAKIGQLNPLGRYGIAQEIANVALFLASDDASYVNGAAYAVDGGLSASLPVAPGRWA